MNGAMQKAGNHLSRLRDRAVGRFPWVRNLGWAEVILLSCAFITVIVVNQFIELTDDVKEGDTTEFDQWAVRSLRRADDPALPIGRPGFARSASTSPRWAATRSSAWSWLPSRCSSR